MSAEAGGDRRAMRRLRVVVIVWVIAWACLGIATGVEIWRLDQIGASVAVNARALADTGRSLASLSSLPLVGGEVDTISRSIDRAATDTEAEARASQEQAHLLGILLGYIVALLPALPAVGIYLSLRKGWLTMLIEPAGHARAGDSAGDGPGGTVGTG